MGSAGLCSVPKRIRHSLMVTHADVQRLRVSRLAARVWSKPCRRSPRNRRIGNERARLAAFGHQVSAKRLALPSAERGPQTRENPRARTTSDVVRASFDANEGSASGRSRCGIGTKGALVPSLPAHGALTALGNRTRSCTSTRSLRAPRGRPSRHAE